jgi:hypothetical protein
MTKKHDQLSAANELADELAADQAALAREPLTAREALADARAQAPDEVRKSLPAPKPGDPHYDWSQHYPEGTELFTYAFPDGKMLALKAFSAIYSKTWLYKISELQSDIDIEFAALKRGGCPEAHAVLMELDDTVGDPIADLYNAWIGAEGLDSGE